MATQLITGYLDRTIAEFQRHGDNLILEEDTRATRKFVCYQPGDSPDYLTPVEALTASSDPEIWIDPDPQKHSPSHGPFGLREVVSASTFKQYMVNVAERGEPYNHSAIFPKEACQ